MRPDQDKQTYAIIGAAMEVHRELGRGFLEAVYQEALEIELGLRGIPFERQVPLVVRYKSAILTAAYRADFVCYGEVLVEIKAADSLTSVDQAQVLNYLKATGLKRALLLNFGSKSLEFERLVREY